MGRKRIEIDLAAVEAAAADGLNEAEVAARLGISVNTLGRRKRDLEGFGDAIKRGKAKADAEVSNALFELVRQRHLGAIVWWEKTRKGYSERFSQEVTGRNGGPVTMEIRAIDYRNGLTALAPRSDADSESSSKNESAEYGQTVGQNSVG